MKNFILLLIACSSTLCACAQIISTSNQPSQVYPGGGIETGAHVFGVFAGRTPCQELMTELNLDKREECAKRKLRIILYRDSISGKPTTYEMKGMGDLSGKGKWFILQGMPSNHRATVFQLELNSKTSLFLLKGDENVLFVLDKNKNFLIGNAKFSYTLNRVKN